MKKFNKYHDTDVFYNIVYEQFNNFNDLSESNVYFLLPLQNIGDCSFKSFIFSFILLDYYNIFTFPSEKLKEIIKYDENDTDEQNIYRSIQNFWIFFHNLFIETIKESLPKINITDDYNDNNWISNINHQLNLLYGIKENFNRIKEILILNKINIENEYESTIDLIDEKIKKTNEDLFIYNKNKLEDINLIIKTPYWREIRGVFNIFFHELYTEFLKLKTINACNSSNEIDDILHTIILYCFNPDNGLYIINNDDGLLEINNDMYLKKILDIFEYWDLIKILKNFLLNTIDIKYKYKNFKDLC